MIILHLYYAYKVQLQNAPAHGGGNQGTLPRRVCAIRIMAGCIMHVTLMKHANCVNVSVDCR